MMVWVWEKEKEMEKEMEYTVPVHIFQDTSDPYVPRPSVGYNIHPRMCIWVEERVWHNKMVPIP